MLNIAFDAAKPTHGHAAAPAVEPTPRRAVRPYKLDCRYVKRDPHSLEPLETHSPELSAHRGSLEQLLLATPAQPLFHRDTVGAYCEPPSMPCTPERPLPSPLSLHLSRLMQAIEPLSDVKVACLADAQDCSDPSTAQTPAFSTRTGRGGCPCKKSRCLKLYCECFASQNGCSADCDCAGCFNRSEFEEITDIVRRELLGANPAAFEPKVGPGSHTKGCACRRNHCQKKYCECLHAGVRCSALCRCLDCGNAKEGGDPCRVYRPITKSRKVPLGLLIEKFQVLSRNEHLSHIPND